MTNEKKKEYRPFDDNPPFVVACFVFGLLMVGWLVFALSMIFFVLGSLFRYIGGNSIPWRFLLPVGGGLIAMILGVAIGAVWEWWIRRQPEDQKRARGDRKMLMIQSQAMKIERTGK